MILEVGTKKNRKVIYNHLKSIDVNMFSQKRAWKKVQVIEDIPANYKEGSLFISLDNQMLWS